MALTKATYNIDNISSLSSTPNSTEGLTAAQLQAKFDKTGSDLKTYINDTLTAEIDTGVSNLQSGWTPAEETWIYVSTDDPTGTIKIQADVTTKYSLGMRIKFTNGGNTIYGILTKIGTYGGDASGYTYLTFLHEIDATDSLALYLMANSAITNPYYSSTRVPFGFPMGKSKWTIYYSTTTSVNQATPSQNTWYNIDNRGITLPIGAWDVSYSIPIDDQATGGNTSHAFYSTLSTANNSANASLLCGTQLSTATDYVELEHNSNTLQILVASKTAYYLNVRSTLTTCNRLRYGAWKIFRIQATCNYL